jgi:hypothetical protein
MTFSQAPQTRRESACCFVADQFIYSRPLRILVVVDGCTCECLALIADTYTADRPAGKLLLVNRFVIG